MRFLLASAVALGLQACVSAPPRVTAADRADPLAALNRLGAADSLTPEGAEALLGPPHIARRDGKGAILTWRTPACALVLVFAEQGGALRLGALDVAARTHAAPAPPLSVCVAEARGAL